MIYRRGFLAGAVATLAGACAKPYLTDAEIEAAYPPIGAFTTGEGQRVHYWEAGEGPPVVLIHGASGNLRDWTFDIAPMLAERYRVIAFDRPGFGYTDRPERGFDPAVQARVLADAARSLDIVRPVVVGHSWGAAVALAWAMAHPGKLRGVVSVSGAVMPFGSGGPSFLSWTGLDSVIADAYGAYLRASAGDGGIERFVARAFRPQDPPEGYAEYVGGPLALRPKTLAANSEDLRTLGTSLRRQSSGYAGITAPTTVINGTADWLIRPERHAVPLAEALPNAELVLLDGVGHMAHHADPMALGAAIDRVAAA